MYDSIYIHVKLRNPEKYLRAGSPWLDDDYWEWLGTRPETELKDVLSLLVAPGSYWASRNDPLTAQQWTLAKQEAARLGLPKEFVAATLAAEIVFDTDWKNTLYDLSTSVLGKGADLGYTTRDRPLFDSCYGLLEGFHDYFGLAPILEPLGIGSGSAPGIGNMHAGVAVRTEAYFNAIYPGQNLLPDLDRNNTKGVRLRTLLSDEGNIRYVAAYLRQWADLRTGKKSDHTDDLTDTDMRVIYTAYRCYIGPGGCYESLQDFQAAQTPSPYGHSEDFAMFLPLYRNRP